jgi:hypothetical protein
MRQILQGSGHEQDELTLKIVARLGFCDLSSGAVEIEWISMH